MVIVGGSGSADAVAAAATAALSQGTASLCMHFTGSVRQALEECHVPAAAPHAAIVARLGGRSALEASLEFARTAAERSRVLLCLTQPQLKEQGVSEWASAIAATPGCCVCVAADPTLYAAEDCERCLLGASGGGAVAHLRLSLPTTADEAAARVRAAVPGCEGDPVAAEWLSERVGAQRDELLALAALLDAQEETPPPPSSSGDDAEEAAGAEPRVDATLLTEARLEAARANLVGTRARSLARLLGLPSPDGAKDAPEAADGNGAAAASPNRSASNDDAAGVGCGDWVWEWLAELAQVDVKLSGGEALVERAALASGGAATALRPLLLQMCEVGDGGGGGGDGGDGGDGGGAEGGEPAMAAAAAAAEEAALERGLRDLDALVRAGLVCLDFARESDDEAVAAQRWPPGWSCAVAVGPLTLDAFRALHADEAASRAVARRRRAREHSEDIAQLREYLAELEGAVRAYRRWEADAELSLLFGEGDDGRAAEKRERAAHYALDRMKHRRWIDNQCTDVLRRAGVLGVAAALPANHLCHEIRREGFF